MASDVAPKNIAKGDTVNQDDFSAAIWKLEADNARRTRQRWEAVERTMRDKLSGKATLANIANKRSLWRM